MMLFVNLFTYFIYHKRINHYKLYYYNSTKLLICFRWFIWSSGSNEEKNRLYAAEHDHIVHVGWYGNQMLHTKCSLGDVINRIFKCMICHSLSSGPASIGNCCKQVLGCGDCLEPWFINNNLCPHWQADNDNMGTNKVLTTAFDELLEKTRSLFDAA